MSITSDYRVTGPSFTKIRHIDLPQNDHFSLDNGIDVYAVNMGTQPVVKLEFIFEAGRAFEQHQLAGRITAALIKEGIPGKNSEEIAELFDYYGASIQTSSGMDTSKFVLYCLEKYLSKLLSVVRQLLTEPTFPEAEYRHYIKNAKHRIELDKARNEIVSYRSFTEKIFGATHPYGYNSTVEGFDAFDYDQIDDHYRRCYWTDQTKIFLSGRISDTTKSLINDHFGEIQLNPGRTSQIKAPEQFEAEKIEELAPNNIQASLRIGKPLFSRSHPDYCGMFLTSMIMGGYFGSRLMKSIREEKGYTYSIFAGLDTMRHAGYLYISTELDNSYARPALSAIYQEIDRLQTELVADDEMDMVKNYIMGSLLNMIDGAFNTSRLLKTMILSGQRYESFQDFVGELVATDASRVRDMAQKYLDTKSFLELTVINNSENNK